MRAITFWPHHFLLNWFLGKNSGSFFRVVAIFASSLISIWLLALIKGTLPKTFGFWLYTFFLTFAHKLCWLKTSQILTSTMSLFYFFSFFAHKLCCLSFVSGSGGRWGLTETRPSDHHHSLLLCSLFAFAFAPGPKYLDHHHQGQGPQITIILFCFCTRAKILRLFFILFVQHQHQHVHHQTQSPQITIILYCVWFCTRAIVLFIACATPGPAPASTFSSPNRQHCKLPSNSPLTDQFRHSCFARLPFSTLYLYCVNFTVQILHNQIHKRVLYENWQKDHNEALYCFNNDIIWHAKFWKYILHQKFPLCCKYIDTHDVPCRVHLCKCKGHGVAMLNIWRLLSTNADTGMRDISKYRLKILIIGSEKDRQV